MLTTWSVVTGKLLNEVQLPKGQDFSKYEVFGCNDSDNTYKKGWYQGNVLLVDKTNVI